MAYELNALIADIAAIQTSGLAHVVLPEGWALIPLNHPFWKQLGGRHLPILAEARARTAGDDEFGIPAERTAAITEAVASAALITELIVRLSAASPIAYVEADYWAGCGDQAAAVWERGAVVLAPVVADDAINQALRAIGVRARSTDEFSTLDLGRYRTTAKWAEATLSR